MIRIRYRDFSYGTHNWPGFHGMAEACPDGVIVYLVPGLAVSQRRAVLRRLRQEASRGCGPALPLPQLALALGSDKIQWARRRLAALIRLHPARVTLAALVVAVAMGLFVLASAAGQSCTAQQPGPRDLARYNAASASANMACAQSDAAGRSTSR